MTGSDSQPTIIIERHGAVLLVTLNRPDKANALNPALLAGLDRAWDEAEDESCRAVVIAAAGKNFCAGGDLAAGRAEPDAMDLRRAFHPRLLRLAALAKPVVAAINGAVAGAGLGLALAADIRILAEDARMVPAWVQIGLVPDFGASWFAARLIGEARTFEWFATGRVMPAAEALSIGLASEIVSPAVLVDRALELAQALAAQPGNAVALTKRLLAQVQRHGLAEQLEAEAAASAAAHRAPDREKQVAARLASFAKAG